jgi:hypothetical protein
MKIIKRWVDEALSLDFDQRKFRDCSLIMDVINCHGNMLINDFEFNDLLFFEIYLSLKLNESFCLQIFAGKSEYFSKVSVFIAFKHLMWI